MKGNEIVARQRRDRLRRAAVGHPVRVKAVDQTIEDGVGDVFRILGADLQARQHLLALPLDFSGRERRKSCHVGQHLHAAVEAVLHHDHVEERQIGGRARPHRAPDEIDGVGEFLRRTRRAVTGRFHPLIKQGCREPRRAELFLRIRRRTRSDEQTHAHDRLLVVKHDHHLETVGQRLQFVGRKLDIARRQRARRTLRGPVADLSRGCADTHGPRGDETRGGLHRLDSSHCAPGRPFGRIVNTRRFSGLK